MSLNEEEQRQVNSYRQRQVDKIQSSNLTDEQKKDKLDLLETEEYHKVIPMRVREVAPHQWEAY